MFPLHLFIHAVRVELESMAGIMWRDIMGLDTEMMSRDLTSVHPMWGDAG
jgi:hypothetical protein